MNAGASHLARGDAADLFGQLGIPGLGQTQLRGKDGGAGLKRMPVDAIEAEKERNPEAMLITHLTLQGDRFLSSGPDDRAHMFAAQEVAVGLRLLHAELADLLFQGHLREKVVEPLIQRGLRVFVEAGHSGSFGDA